MTARPITPADLYAMGDYIRDHWFSPRYVSSVAGTPFGCGCFIHAAHRRVTMNNDIIWAELGSVVGTDWDENSLIAAGWTEGCTEDAAAACYIAGDILACEQARRR